MVVLRAGDGLLNNGGDAAVLYNAAGATVDEVAWTAAAPGDRSLARQPDGGAWAPGWQAPTRGVANAAAGSGGGGGFAAAGTPNVTCAAGTERVAVASFNIQNLGAAKVGRPAVMAALGAIAARYDIVAVRAAFSTRRTWTALQCNGPNHLGLWLIRSRSSAKSTPARAAPRR